MCIYIIYYNYTIARRLKYVNDRRSNQSFIILTRIEKVQSIRRATLKKVYCFPAAHTSESHNSRHNRIDKCRIYTNIIHRLFAAGTGLEFVFTPWLKKAAAFLYIIYSNT